MRKFRIVALSTGVALAAGIAVAFAGTPFGGDDAGIIPSQRATLKCESSISKALGKFFGCVGKCTASRSSGKFPDDIAEENCESLGPPSPGCLLKFQLISARTHRGDTTGGCDCIPQNFPSPILEKVDAMNNIVYCNTTSGTPFGGDDTGFLPVAKSATAKCEDGINKLVGKAAACILKCHNSRASGKLADDTAEEACEKNNAGKSCLEIFTAGVTTAQSKDTSGGCNCVNGTTLANAIESLVDQDVNALLWCGSPSGAFLQ